MTAPAPPLPLPPTTPDGLAIYETIRARGPISLADLHYALLLEDRVIRDHVRLHRDSYACLTTWTDGFPLRRYSIALIESESLP